MAKSSISISEINHAVMYGQFTDEQLNSIWMAVKYAKAQQAKMNIYTFRPGDVVKFVNRGREIKGVVAKVMQKNIQVKEAGSYTIWKVPANMLESA